MTIITYTSPAYIRNNIFLGFDEDEEEEQNPQHFVIDKIINIDENTEYWRNSQESCIFLFFFF